MLEIAGYGGLPVPNTFIRQDDETRHLGVILPGLRYRPNMPGLYYLALHLRIIGADVLMVDYRYDQRPDLATMPDAERRAWWLADATASLESGISQRRYDRITIVGKSLGTVTMASLLADDERLRAAEAIWLTPALKAPGLPQLIHHCRQRGLMMIGTADPYYDADLLAGFRQQGLQVLELPDVDHRLECPDGAVRSAEAMADMTRAFERFLAGERPSP